MSRNKPLHFQCNRHWFIGYLWWWFNFITHAGKSILWSLSATYPNLIKQPPFLLFSILAILQDCCTNPLLTIACTFNSFLYILLHCFCKMITKCNKVLNYMKHLFIVCNVSKTVLFKFVLLLLNEILLVLTACHTDSW